MITIELCESEAEALYNLLDKKIDKLTSKNDISLTFKRGILISILHKIARAYKS